MDGHEVERGPDSKRWWALSGDELGKTAWDTGTWLEKDQRYRYARALAMLSLYEGRNLRGLRAGTYTLEAENTEYNLNISRAACDTVIAEIAGRQKPMPKFQTSGADWKTKRRAQKLEKFVLGVLHQNQHPYLNSWPLMEAAFMDACIFGKGIVKVFVDGERIRMERHFAHELFVDPVEARYGNPQSLFHVYTMERDLALANFAYDKSLDISKKRRREIAHAINSADDSDLDLITIGDTPRTAKAIRVVECWRLQHPDGSPGKHAFCIDNKLLHEEDWNRDSFPFVQLIWEQDRMGYDAKGLLEQGESIQLELNANTIKLQERFRLCGAKRTFIEEESVDLEKMQANDAEVMIEYKKGSQPPIETVPKPIAEAEFRYYQDIYEKYFMVTGVSEMRASARKEPGVTAGVAIRTLNDMQTARFALKAKAYESGYVQLTQQIILCVREAAKSNPNFKIRYDEEIKWVDCDVPENTFEITIAPASSLPNEPAGRLQMAQELYSSGIVGVDTFKQLLGWPDLEKEMNNQTSQSRYLEKIIDRMLDADEGNEYVAPDPYILDKPRAMIQTAQAYFDALYDDAPEMNLQALRDYMEGIDELIAEAMPPPPGAGEAPMGGGASGAPPGGSSPFAPSDGAPPTSGEPQARPAIA